MNKFKLCIAITTAAAGIGLTGCSYQPGSSYAASGAAGHNDFSQEETAEKSLKDGEETLHIGTDGIRMSDGEEALHIGIDGIRMSDGEVRAYLGWDGIHMSDGESDASIGWGGIQVTDGESSADIGWDGIQVTDGESSADIGWDGIHLTDGESRISVTALLNASNFDRLFSDDWDYSDDLIDLFIGKDLISIKNTSHTLLLDRDAAEDDRVLFQDNAIFLYNPDNTITVSDSGVTVETGSGSTTLSWEKLGIKKEENTIHIRKDSLEIRDDSSVFKIGNNGKHKAASLK